MLKLSVPTDDLQWNEFQDCHLSKQTDIPTMCKQIQGRFSSQSGVGFKAHRNANSGLDLKSRDWLAGKNLKKTTP